MGERKGADRVMVGRPEEMKPLRRPRHRWEDMWYGGKMDWIHPAQDRDKW
jgi:hypothetical protein